MDYELVMTSEDIQKDKKAWLLNRLSGICGTDVGAILGVSKWKDVVDIWSEKREGIKGRGEELVTSQLEEEPDSSGIVGVRAPMFWGSYIEPVIADVFEKTYQKKLRRQGMIRNKERPWMLADVDRVVVGENSIVEIKTTASWKENEWEGSQIPDTYYLQIQHYLATGGFDKCYVCCLVGGNKLIVKTVERNEDDIKAMLEVEENFWKEHVISNRVPTIADDERYQNPEVTQDMRHWSGWNKERRRNLMPWGMVNEKLANIIRDTAELEAADRNIKRRIELNKKVIRETMGDDYNIISDSEDIKDAKMVVMKHRVRQCRVRPQALREQYPEVYQELREETDVEVLKVRVKGITNPDFKDRGLTYFNHFIATQEELDENRALQSMRIEKETNEKPKRTLVKGGEENG